MLARYQESHAAKPEAFVHYMDMHSMVQPKVIMLGLEVSPWNQMSFI